jgi:hypothetical protein
VCRICKSSGRHAGPLSTVVEYSIRWLDEVIKDVLTGGKVNDGYTSQFLALLGDNLESDSVRPPHAGGDSPSRSR